jgi:hypothetical protein
VAFDNSIESRHSMLRLFIMTSINLRECESSGGGFQLTRQSRSEMRSRAGKLCNRSPRGTASSSFQMSTLSSIVFRIVELKRNPRRKDVREDWNLASSDILSARER